MKQAVLIIGTFNPITLAHIKMADIARSHLSEANIFFVPTADEYLLNKKGLETDMIIPARDRVRLIKEAVSETGYEVFDLEVTGRLDGRTIFTVDYFKEKLGYEQVYICLGADKLKSLHHWYEGERLIDENQFLVINRYGYDFNELASEYVNEHKTHFVEAGACDGYSSVSASEVRRACKEGNPDSIEELVPANAYRYLLNWCHNERRVYEKENEDIS